jgi:hypothetical protein
MTTINRANSALADSSGDPLIGDAQAHIADASTNLSTVYADDASANDLDNDAKRVAAMNTTNTRVNAIATSLNSVLAVLEAHGLVKDA